MTDTDQAHDDVVGRIALVCTRIPGRDRPGEVTVQIRGGDEAWLAYADTEIAGGETVVIISRRGPRAVDVVRF